MPHVTLSGVTVPTVLTEVGSGGGLHLRLTGVSFAIHYSPEEVRSLADQLAAVLGLTLAPQPTPDPPPTHNRQGIPYADPGTYALEYFPDVPQDRTYLAPEEIAAVPDPDPVRAGWCLPCREYHSTEKPHCGSAYQFVSAADWDAAMELHELAQRQTHAVTAIPGPAAPPVCVACGHEEHADFPCMHGDSHVGFCQCDIWDAWKTPMPPPQPPAPTKMAQLEALAAQMPSGIAHLDEPPAELVEPGIHILHEGAVLCRGLPRDTHFWLPGYSWVALAGWDRATCGRCRNVAAGLLPWGAMRDGAVETREGGKGATEGEAGVARHAASEGNLEAASSPKQASAPEHPAMAIMEGFCAALSDGQLQDAADVPGDATVLAHLHRMLGTVYTAAEILLALDRAQVPSQAPYARWKTEVERAMTFLPRTQTQGDAQE